MREARSRHADELYENLGSDRARQLCSALFKALTLRESENRGIRRPQTLGRLAQIGDVPAAELAPLIEVFRQPGVTSLMPPPEVPLLDNTVVDISHESLMRVWVWLRDWVEQEASSVGIFHRFAESARLHDKGKAGLYRDPELGIALCHRLGPVVPPPIYDLARTRPTGLCHRISGGAHLGTPDLFHSPAKHGQSAPNGGSPGRLAVKSRLSML